MYFAHHRMQEELGFLFAQSVVRLLDMFLRRKLELFVFNTVNDYSGEYSAKI